MSDKGHILVSPKGFQIQRQILNETISDFPNIQSPKYINSVRAKKSKVNQFSCTTTSLSSYSLPRSGYFGPRELRTPSPVLSSKAFNLYPDYQSKDPKDYPPRHFCALPRKTISKGIKALSPDVTKGKYVHHTLYDLAVESKLGENPSMYGLNLVTFGKDGKIISKAKKEGIAEDWNEVEAMKRSMKIEKEAQRSHGQSFTSIKSGSASNVPLNTAASRFGSTGFPFNKFANTTRSRYKSPNRDFELNEEKILGKHIENQRRFEELLTRCHEETKKKMRRFEENQHEAPEFINKLKEVDHSIEGMNSIRLNEDSRSIKRLKEYHQKRFVGIWAKHGQNKTTEVLEIERPLGLRGGPLFNLTTHNFDIRKKSNNPTPLKERKKKVAKSPQEELVSREEEDDEKYEEPKSEKRIEAH